MRGRILIIDDSELILEFCCTALREAGFEAVGTTLASAGITAASSLGESLVHASEPFDLILLDVTMPSISGERVATLLKKTWGIDAPIYLFSDLREEELKLRAGQAEAQGYICKSWGIERLVSLVTEIVESRRATRPPAG